MAVRNELSADGNEREDEAKCCDAQWREVKEQARGGTLKRFDDTIQRPMTTKLC